MEKMPVLSIGIIFKNEIRCLERCLRSFDGLRKRVPCQLVAADTGSDDGSREVAKRYTDILFDFPWIDDFAAARNAVMERCTGTWFLFVDADEWLDDDFSELEAFLKNPKLGEGYRVCAVVIRNYMNADLTGDFGDFMVSRLIRMSTGMRFEGAIHEHLDQPVGNMLGLSKTVFHHDGYVGLSGEAGAKKRERNMRHLRKKLEEEPNNLLVLLQCIESSVGYELERHVRHGIKAVEEKRPFWKELGPPIYRYAVSLAKASDLPEFHQWADRARELFPESLYVRIDINYFEFTFEINKEHYTEAIPKGEAYLRATEDYRAKRYNAADLAVSSVSMLAPNREDEVRIHLANAYFYTGAPEKCWQMLRTIPVRRLNEENIRNYFGMLLNVYAQSEIDTSGAVRILWDEISPLGEESPQMQAVLFVAAMVFPQKYRDSETELGFRHAYQALLSLAEKCGPGIAARILEAQTVPEMREALLQVTDWDQISIHALAYALEQGLAFPMPEKPLRMEDADRLAKRLTTAGEVICRLVASLESARWQRDPAYMNWSRALAMAAVETYPWEKPILGKDHAIAVARAFARVEEDFLPAYYSQEALREENLPFLPPLHRFGYFCAQAFAALEAGDAISYVRQLRAGLVLCEGMNDMVEFLVNYTPELQLYQDPELLLLAEKVKIMLAAYPADDPAVAAVKQSPAYQKVAHLIEGDSV